MPTFDLSSKVNLTEATPNFGYNGVEVGVCVSSVTATPQRDEAKRTVTGVQYKISVKGIVTPLVGSADTTTGLPMDFARDQLSKDGGQLFFSNKGFGPLRVNVGNVWDSTYGPKVEQFRWIPLGGALAAWCEITLITTIPECTAATYRGKLMALNFGTTIDFNKDGLASITTVGYAEIPLTRNSVTSRLPNDHISLYLEQLIANVPLGFQRESRPVKFSLDGRRADFTFVDKQLPVVLPYGVTTINMHHDLGSQLSPGGFHIWSGHISGSISNAVGLKKSDTFARFFAIAYNRLTTGFTTLLEGPGPGGVVPAGAPPGETIFRGVRNLNPATPNGWVMIVGFRANENIFGLDTNFELKYQIISPLNIFEIFTRAGFWKPILNASFSAWKASMDLTVNRPRGAINFGVNLKADVILDLCMPSRAPNKPNRLEVAGVSETDDELSPIQARQRQLSGLKPETSWLLYHADTIYQESGDYIVRHKPMGGGVQDQDASNPQATDGFRNLQKDVQSVLGSQAITVPDTLHQVRTPSATIRLRGYAIRLGFKIPLPQLVSVNGIDCVRCGTPYVMDTVLDVYEGQPLYARVWAIDYMLAKPLTGDMVTLGNPVTGQNGKL